MKKDIGAEEYRKRFGIFIRNAREKQKLYQREVAEMMGVTDVQIYHIEKGARKLDLGVAFKLCDLLNADMQDFMDNYL